MGYPETNELPAMALAVNPSINCMINKARRIFRLWVSPNASGV